MSRLVEVGPRGQYRVNFLVGFAALSLEASYVPKSRAADSSQAAAPFSPPGINRPMGSETEKSVEAVGKARVCEMRHFTGHKGRQVQALQATRSYREIEIDRDAALA